MQLKDYIQGNRRGKEANWLERDALNDPFLQGALDGFDSVAGDHVQIIEQLEKKYSHPVIARPSKKRKLFYWAAAASILLLIGFGVYFLQEKNSPNDSSLAETPPGENERVISADSFVEKSESKESKPKSLTASKEYRSAERHPALASDKSEEVAEYMDKNKVIDTNSVSETAEETSLVADIVEKEQKTQMIQGKVVDEAGEPLPGVSIVQEGTQNGTATDIDGAFTLQLAIDDSSKLMASYLGYAPQEINPSIKNQTVTLKPDNFALNEVVVMGYGTLKKSSVTGSVASMQSSVTDSVSVIFGEKEFQTWCQQEADKNVCAGNETTVKVSFFIGENGKPLNIQYEKYSCEEAKEEMDKLLSSSPTWTKTNRKVTMTIQW